MINEKDTLWLMASLYNCNYSDVLLNRSKKLTARNKKKINSWIKRRKVGEPLQYITNQAPFLNQQLYVDKRVLIPRPETEMLVEIALKLFPQIKSPIRVLDVGTGSGAIAIGLKQERPHWQLFASDISHDAVIVAKKNAKKTKSLITFKKGNLFEPWLNETQGFDLVIANLPYLDPKIDLIDKEVKKWEPALALFDRKGMLAKKLIQECIDAKIPILTILLELSARLAYSLEKIFSKHPKVKAITRQADLNNKKRYLIINL